MYFVNVAVLGESFVKRDVMPRFLTVLNIAIRTLPEVITQVTLSCQFLAAGTNHILYFQVESEAVLHYITSLSFQMPLAPKVTTGASTIGTCYKKYCPPAQSGTSKKENLLRSGANCSKTHSIISLMVPHEFNVIEILPTGPVGYI